MNTKENYKRWIAKNHERKLVYMKRYNKRKQSKVFFMDEFPDFLNILDETKPTFSIRYIEGGFNPFDMKI
jgi:hypothetical protein